MLTLRERERELPHSFPTTGARTAAIRRAPDNAVVVWLSALIPHSRIAPSSSSSASFLGLCKLCRASAVVCRTQEPPSSSGRGARSFQPTNRSFFLKLSWSLPFVCSDAALPTHHCLRVVLVAWPLSPSHFCPSAQSAQTLERRFYSLLCSRSPPPPLEPVRFPSAAAFVNRFFFRSAVLLPQPHSSHSAA
ncbi:hypothetical protein S245_057408 [Arachis hypogaea]